MNIRRALLWVWAILSVTWLLFIVVWVKIVNCVGPDRVVLCNPDPDGSILTPTVAIVVFGIGLPLAALMPVMVVWWLTGVWLHRRSNTAN